ncbi:MAG: hypothetical protein ACHQ1H_12915 [Nitrososphaerales archaeon]
MGASLPLFGGKSEEHLSGRNWGSIVGLPVGITTLSERRLDKKRRVSIPTVASNLRAGDKVVVISSDDFAVISSDRKVAQILSQCLQNAEKRRTGNFLKEWDDLLAKSGLLDLPSHEIHEIAGQGMRRLKKLQNE